MRLESLVEFSTIKQTSEVGIPFFSDLPIIGVLFKSTTTRIAQQEFSYGDTKSTRRRI